MGNVLQAPSAPRDGLHAIEADVATDRDPEPDIRPDQPGMVFRIIKGRPAAWHTVTVSRASSGKMVQSDVGVTVHRGIRRGSELWVSSEPANSQAVGIIRNLCSCK